MPFTPSHAALALPFLRTPLLPAAVVIGTVTPDLPYFLPFPTGRPLTHAPAGVPTIDLGIGLLAFVLWNVFRAPLVDLSPAWLRTRVELVPWRRGHGWLVAILLLIASLIVGTITHLLWDSFTHPGALVDHVSLLRIQLGPLPLEKWLQHASSIGGLAVLAAWSVRWVRRTPVRTDVAIATPRARLGAWLAAVALFVVSGLVTWGNGIRLGSASFDPILVFVVARVSIGVTLAFAVVACFAWLVYVRINYRERRTATTLPSTSA